ncbi:MAG TPA: SpoIIE family protein phosphatase [Gemmatimonadales bacterium]|jgi:serine/threonine protein phosphatase PrpC
MASPPQPARYLDVGVASTALDGQGVSGDLHLIRSVNGSRQRGELVAVVDGLGHGAEAAAAARIAIETLDRYAGASIPELIQRCHEALVGSRGVVMSVAQFDVNHDTMTWVGLGNVAGVLVPGDRAGSHPYTTLVTRGGIVGTSLGHGPVVRPWVIPIQPRDLLVLATDGLHANFTDDLSLQQDPQETAAMLLARHGKGTDDALVLIAQYLGRR